MPDSPSPVSESPPASAPTLIVAVVVTYRREFELARLLQSLQDTAPPRLVVVVDNAGLSSTAATLRRFKLRTFYVALPENPGPGAGWKQGMEIALQQEPNLTHFLVLDDDVTLPAHAVEKLVRASANAAITCPMLLDSQNEIWAFPEPKDRSLRKSIRQIRTPADCLNVIGTAPLPFVWCTGACVLLQRAAVDAVGFYRTDFWMLGEDLEYSMRVAAHGKGLFLPDVFVPHLPPASADASASDAAHRRKFTSLLQNLAYLSFHHPHSQHLKTYLAGNVRRYLRTFGWNFRSLRTAAGCLWKGAVLARPAGAG